jgi:hypothetical protein
MPLPVQFVVLNASTKLMLVTPLQLSVAVARPVRSVVGGSVHSRVMSAGHVITGAVVSLNLIVCWQLTLLPQPSVAVQVRKIVPRPVQLVVPKASAKVMAATALHASAAVATPVLFVVGGSVHSRVMSAGHVITGG